MLEVQIPADVQAYKSKLVAGFSVRQFLSIVVAIAIIIPYAIIGKKFLPEDLLIWTIILIAVPIFAVGFVKTQDMHFEEFAKFWLSSYFFPQKRYLENADIDELDDVMTSIIEEKLDSEVEEDII